MQPAVEVIDLSNSLGTAASFVVVGFDTLVPLALLVWAVLGFWRANRRWKEGDRLAREAILLDRLPPSGVVALQGLLRTLDDQKSVRVQAGKRHEHLSFPPFLLGLAGGETVRVDAGNTTSAPAKLPIVELEAGKDVYVVGELGAGDGAPDYRREAALPTVRPPSASRFIVSADPLGKPYRGRAVANLLLVIVLTLMVLSLSGAAVGFLSRLANGKTGMAEILTTKVTQGSRREYCTAVARRPDGRRMEAKLGAAACDDPKAAGDVSPGDQVPIVYVPGSGNDQFGTEAGVEGDTILFVVVLLAVVLLLYGFVRRLVSQDDRYVETTP